MVQRPKPGLVFHFPHYQSGDGPHSTIRVADLKLIKFYEEVSPSNVANVDAILEHYAGMGQLEDLFEGLEAKYPGRKLERPDVKREEDAKPQSKSSGDGSGATKNGDGQTFSI